MKAVDIDVAQFMLHGCSPVMLDHDVLKQTREQILTEQWVQNHDAPSTQRASWIVDPHVDVNPPQYQPILTYVDQVMKQTVGDTFTRYKFNLWKGAQELDWHFDESGISMISWLIYFGDEVWEQDTGGLLQVQCRPFGVIYTFEPTFGTAVMMNGQSEDFVHRVTKMTGDQLRLSMLIGYRRKDR